MKKKKEEYVKKMPEFLSENETHKQFFEKVINMKIETDTVHLLTKRDPTSETSNNKGNSPQYSPNLPL